MKKQLLTRVLTCGALLTMTGSVIVPTFSTLSVHADTQKAVADDTSARVITLTKYQATDINDHSLAGNGTASNPSRSVLEGVEFKLQRVKAIAGKNLTDAATAKEGVDYTIDTTFTTRTAKTNSNGQISWNLGTGKANDGIYLVTETDSSTAKDPLTNKEIEVTTHSNPFFVQVPMTNRTTKSDLIYDIVVEPKNVIENDLDPVKTINGKAGDSVLSGMTFNWELDTKIPNGLYSKAVSDTTVNIVDKAGNQLYNSDKTIAQKHFASGEYIYIENDGTQYYDFVGTAVAPSEILSVSNFSITDTLDENLTYQNSSVWVLPKGSSTYVELPASYYTVTTPANNNGTFKMSLTKAGIMAIGGNSVVDKNGNVIGEVERISTHVTTFVEEGFNGLIPNTFHVTYQTPGGKPGDQTPPKTPKTFNGGFDIEKVDKGDHSKKLAGAVFHISTSEANATAGKFLAEDGKSYTTDEASAAGVDLISATSNSNGRAEFNGLALNWTDDNQDGEVGDTETIENTYWVTETTAPEGYELIRSPQQVVVNLSTYNDTLVELTVEDEKQTDLPFTGGAGTALMVTIALGAITLGTVTIVMNKKKNRKQI